MICKDVGVMIKQMVCSGCNKTCLLEVDKINKNVIISGNSCDNGIIVANKVINNNADIFTSLVRLKSSKTCNVVSVKSTRPIDKCLWIECSKALSRLYVGTPIKIGDIICKNILNTGVDIVCTKNIYK